MYGVVYVNVYVCMVCMYVCEGGMVLSYKISMRLNVATVVEKKRREVV